MTLSKNDYVFSEKNVASMDGRNLMINYLSNTDTSTTIIVYKELRNQFTADVLSKKFIELRNNLLPIGITTTV